MDCDCLFRDYHVIDAVTLGRSAKQTCPRTALDVRALTGIRIASGSFELKPAIALIRSVVIDLSFYNFKRNAIGISIAFEVALIVFMVAITLHTDRRISDCHFISPRNFLRSFT